MDDQRKKHHEKFWINDPSILLMDFHLIPRRDMTRSEKLNALTRLAGVITAILYAYKYEYWQTFLAIAIAIIVLLSMVGKEDYSLKEHFTAVPTYQSTSPQAETSVAPLFAEEWQIYPPAYDIYANVPPPITFEEPLLPQSYPYGQYLTHTNLMPQDENAVRQMSGSPRAAREFANDAWTRHSLAFRDNMTKINKKLLAQRFQQSSLYDNFSPYNSY